LQRAIAEGDPHLLRQLIGAAHLRAHVPCQVPRDVSTRLLAVIGGVVLMVDNQYLNGIGLHY